MTHAAHEQRTAIATGAAQSIPADLAPTASFLVSPGAGFVSGQVVHVAGGPVD